jgi:hypothetical protein
MPEAAWFGLVVALYCCWWQLTHVIAVPAYTPLTWQEEHAVVTCAPVNGNRVVL